MPPAVVPAWLACLACAAALASPGRVAARDAPITFSPAPGVSARLQVRDHKVALTVAGPRGKSTATFDPETEQALRIHVEDYNFDGHRDFSISHVDDGMGTYDLYDIHVYAPKSGRFVPLAPRCGEAFVNIRLLRKQRVLVNSYMDSAERSYRTCAMRF